MMPIALPFQEATDGAAAGIATDGQVLAGVNASAGEWGHRGRGSGNYPVLSVMVVNTVVLKPFYRDLVSKRTTGVLAKSP